MPTSHEGQVGKIIELLKAVSPQSILDVGIGFGKYGFLAREYLDVSFEKNDSNRIRIDGIEAFEDYIRPHHHEIYNSLFIGNALDILEKKQTVYDLILCIDVLEHFTRKDGKRILNLLVKSGKLVLVSTPRFPSSQGASHNNEYEAHLSKWKKKDFKRSAIDCCFIWDEYSHLVLLGRNGIPEKTKRIIAQNKVKFRKMMLKRFIKDKINYSY